MKAPEVKRLSEDEKDISKKVAHAGQKSITLRTLPNNATKEKNTQKEWPETQEISVREEASW